MDQWEAFFLTDFLMEQLEKYCDGVVGLLVFLSFLSKFRFLTLR